MDSLKIKETDRIAAMQSELLKFGINTEISSKGTFRINPNNNSINPTKPINTYNDHRMAMSIAPLCIPFGKIIIDNPDVVKKSYPNFWIDLEDAGFEVERV